MSQFKFRCKRCGNDFDEQAVALTCCSNTFNVETYETNKNSGMDGNMELRLSNFKLEDEYYTRMFIRFAQWARQFDFGLEIDHDFRLTFVQFKSLMKRKTCFYTGVNLEHDYNASISKREDNDIVLIKKDDKKGFNKDNIVACSNEMRAVIATIKRVNGEMNIDRFVKGLETYNKDMKGE